MRQIVKNSLCWKQMENPTQTGRFGYKNKMFSMQIKFPNRHFSPALFFSGGGWGRVQKKIKSRRLNIPQWSSQDLANSSQNSGFSSDCSELPLINGPSCHGPRTTKSWLTISTPKAELRTTQPFMFILCIFSKRSRVDKILTILFWRKNNLKMSMTLNYIPNLAACLYIHVCK